MDFYRAQDQARRKTWQLAALFGAAVLVLVALTNVLVALVALGFSGTAALAAPDFLSLLQRIPVSTWIWVSIGVVGVISAACLYKYFIVRGGGRAIAESLGGRRIVQNTSDRQQRRVLNVVEEMALAAGIAVPPVYLVPEPSINAFAAGFSPDDAVIGVNQGTIEHLSRDELQGVIAHEFSHILNGDTRINLRLIALLHGILFIGLVGGHLLRGAGRGSRSRSGSSGGAPVLALGLGLMVIGYGGTFFGNLIKAAVSRQREYLADAAAVQFTRNPQGIAGALKKIGGLSYGSAMGGAGAREASHLFFGQAVNNWLSGLMATHPPLPQRITAIEPYWDGKFPKVQAGTGSGTGPGEDASGFAGTTAADADLLEVQVNADSVAAAVGDLNEVSDHNAQVLLDSTTPALQDAARAPASAQALVLAMLLSQDPDIRRSQVASLFERLDRGIPEEMARLWQQVAALDDLRRLTLVETAMPALKEMSTAQYRRFNRILVTLIQRDQRVDLFEWVLHRVLLKELKPAFERPQNVRQRYRRVDQVAAAARTLISALACCAGQDEARRLQAFTGGMEMLALDGALDQRPDPNFQRLNAALNQLRQLRPLAKPSLIKACARAVLADDRVTTAEGALLQGIAATLDCPLPPSIYGQRNP